MANPQGTLKVTAGGNEYTLFLGMSVLADMQDKYGQDVLDKLDPPAGASENWMPDLKIVSDLFKMSLQRHHADVADRWLVDDIIAENGDALQRLTGASLPDAPSGKSSGNVKRPRKTAA